MHVIVITTIHAIIYYTMYLLLPMYLLFIYYVPTWNIKYDQKILMREISTLFYFYFEKMCSSCYGDYNTCM